jgi:hypothetical protein
MSAQEEAGELQGSILISKTTHGTEFHVLGACAERLQLAVLAMVKGLNIVTDKIVATGQVGYTRTDSLNATWESAPTRRRMPRRLREVTKLGDLD